MEHFVKVEKSKREKNGNKKERNKIRRYSWLVLCCKRMPQWMGCTESNTFIFGFYNIANTRCYDIPTADHRRAGNAERETFLFDDSTLLNFYPIFGFFVVVFVHSFRVFLLFFFHFVATFVLTLCPYLSRQSHSVQFSFGILSLAESRMKNTSINAESVDT